LVALARVRQQAVRLGEAPVEKKFRKCRTVGFEKPLNIAWLEPVSPRQCGDRKISAAEVHDDIGLDRVKSCRTRPAFFGEGGGA
jgi:hypothetical protein